MKIHIIKTVEIPGIPPEVEMESGTLHDLLDGLLRKSYFSKEVVDSLTGELILDGLFQVQLNGVSLHGLHDGLDTALHDGDTLTLTLILLGGG
jgi:hypothetical protein